MNTVHLFFNGAGVHCPDGNGWEKFRELDTARLFITCAESWARWGWKPLRLISTRTKHPLEFVPGGPCEKHMTWYPREYWQFLAAARDVCAANPETLQLFGCIDVFNHGFSCPSRPWKSTEPKFISFQRGHFSLSLFSCNLAGIEAAIKTVMEYDRGELPRLEKEYVSDEMILRNYFKHIARDDLVMAIDVDAHHARLLHHARSTVSTSIERIPLSL